MFELLYKIYEKIEKFNLIWRLSQVYHLNGESLLDRIRLFYFIKNGL